MIDSLQSIYASVDFRNHPYENAESLKALSTGINGMEKGSSKDWILAIHALLSGDSKKSIELLERIRESEERMKTLNTFSKMLYELLAIGYMRMGEQENCHALHSPESCIYPIQGAGLHTKKNGSIKAIAIYTDLVEAYPKEYRHRWLLNLAYMTLDRYPDGVPPHLLLDPTHLKSEFEVERFVNRAIDANADLTTLSGGLVLDDLNGDGWKDIIVSSWGLKDQIEYLENDGTGNFINKTEASGLLGLYGGLNIQPTDFNNDGLVDFHVLRGAWLTKLNEGIYPNSLIQNLGNGQFKDVTIASGLYSTYATQSANWADFNLDGFLDVFVVNEKQIQSSVKAECELFLNQGDGTFKNVAEEVGVNFKGFFKGVSSADFNNNGYPDLYLSNLDGENLLLENSFPQTGRVSFKDVSKPAGVQNPKASFPCWTFDYDNDGWEDIFVSSFDWFGFEDQAGQTALNFAHKSFEAETPRLYRNLGDGTFENVTEANNLNRPLFTMGCNYGDIDNDGYKDFYLGTGAPDFRSIVPNRMFRNNAGSNFQDVTFSAGVGMLQKGHAVGIADIDNDGDQDIYAIIGGAYSGDVFQNVLFENPGNGNDWLSLKLEGSKSNRLAIGAKIKVEIENDNGEQTVYHTVCSGASFGANTLDAEIGLGLNATIRSIQIKWPNGDNKFQEIGSLAKNKKHIVKEGG